MSEQAAVHCRTCNKVFLVDAPVSRCGVYCAPCEAMREVFRWNRIDDFVGPPVTPQERVERLREAIAVYDAAVETQEYLDD